MIEFCQGDLFASRAACRTIPVNCLGVFGAGLAFTFEQIHPTACVAFRKRCYRGEILPGRAYLLHSASTSLRFALVTTKHDWRQNSRLEHVEQGVVELVRLVRDRHVESLAVPALGCGCGRLAWIDVRPVLERHLSVLAIPVELYTPKGTSQP